MIEFLYAGLAAIFFFCGIFLLMSKHLSRLIVGLILLSHSINLTLLLSGGLLRHSAPFMGPDAQAEVADPLPQALILTAIVITFALVAFAIVSQRRFYEETGAEDITSTKVVSDSHKFGPKE